MVFFQQSGEAATIGGSGSRNRATPASSQRGRTIAGPAGGEKRSIRHVSRPGLSTN